MDGDFLCPFCGSERCFSIGFEPGIGEYFECHTCTREFLINRSGQVIDGNYYPEEEEQSEQGAPPCLRVVE